MTDPATLVALTGLLATGQPALETACRSFELVTGRPLEIAGAMLGDVLYRRRIRHLLAFLEEIAPRLQALKEKGIDTKPLIDEFGLPLFDGVQSVGSPELRVMWTGLLESGLRYENAQRPVYVQVLHSLGPCDARALREVAESLSAGLSRERLAALMPEVSLLHALGVVEVSNMPFWHDGSLSSLEHSRQVKIRNLPGPVLPSGKVTLSLLGVGLMDAVDVKAPGDGWGERAVRRTTDLLGAINDQIPKGEPGCPQEDLIRAVIEQSPVSTSPQEVQLLLLFYPKTMGWSQSGDRKSWVRGAPEAEGS